MNALLYSNAKRKNMLKQQSIALTMGEPAGIGPELIIKLLQTSWPVPLTVIGNQQLLRETAQHLDLPFILNDRVDMHEIALPAKVKPGRLALENAAAVVEMLQCAATGALQHRFLAIVTGPIHKGIINQLGPAFSGHTEFFAQASGVDKPLMLLMNDYAKVALVTTHLPLHQVAHYITADNITATLTILQQALIEKFAIQQPNIAVCGLNPHAGENGYLGREELDIIIPALNKLRKQGMKLIGPLPADTAFLPAQLQQVDAIVAMYHDQGLPVVKQMDFANTINVTLGLPFIRTSVDHGTALSLAGRGLADASSFRAALAMAIKLSH